MEIKFEYVRIGKFRKNKLNENLLKENYNIFKAQLTSFFEFNNFKYPTEKLPIPLLLVIPSKGNTVKLSLEDITSEKLKKELKNKFNDKIYKGKYSILIDNMDNEKFAPEYNQQLR